MTSATSGKAHIFGYDITDSNEMEEVRKMTGICPQHDVLFDELTPTEHLVFFARIRGMPEDKIAGEVKAILGDIDLAEKADELAGSLSGGQKRKLSVGIAPHRAHRRPKDHLSRRAHRRGRPLFQEVRPG